MVPASIKDLNVLKIKAVVDAYTHMQQDLDSEKRSMNRIWSKREKQITATLDNVTRMYGALEGLAGANSTLTSIDSLMLDNIAPEEDGEDRACIIKLIDNFC